MISTIRNAIHLEPMMLLEYMNGPEYTVDLLAEKGKVIYEVGRENVVSVLSIAQESVLKYDKVAYETSEAVVKLFNMDGNVGFDFMRNEEGWPFLMDIQDNDAFRIHHNDIPLLFQTCFLQKRFYLFPKAIQSQRYFHLCKAFDKAELYSCLLDLSP